MKDNHNQWTVRLFDQETDFDALLTLRREIESLEPTGNDTSAEGLRNTLNWRGHDPAKDRWVVGMQDAPAELVAHSWVFAQSTERVITFIAVHPAWCRRGIGKVLLPYLLNRATEYGATHVVGGRRANQEAGHHFLSHFGFKAVGNNRFFKAPADVALPEPIWPEGFYVRTFAEVGDSSLLAAANNRCYHDMWGHAENDPTVVDAARIEEGLRDSPEHFNPESIFIAFGPDDEITGVCFGKVFKHQEDEAGSGRPKKVVDSPGVVPELRHLGLQGPLALITMKWLRNNVGRGPIELWTFGDTEEAVKLYHEIGFTLASADHLLEYRLRLG